GGPPWGRPGGRPPPGGAIAPAALAAQPPLTTKNPVACTLPSGCGNCSTRNTSSSTMMPVQRIRGGSREDMLIKHLLIKNLAAILDEAANEMVGDGDRRRRGQAV